jgi:hypothetical protein
MGCVHVNSNCYLYCSFVAQYKVWVKPNGEMPFLYGNHVLKAHLGRITDDTPEHQGVVIYNMSDVPVVSLYSLLQVITFLTIDLLSKSGIRSYCTVNGGYAAVGSYVDCRVSSGGCWRVPSVRGRWARLDDDLRLPREGGGPRDCGMAGS